MNHIVLLAVSFCMFAASFPAQACGTQKRDYAAVPPNAIIDSPSFAPNNLKAKTAAIGTLLHGVNLNAKDFCGGDCGGGKTCSPVDLLTPPDGPGELELVHEGNGNLHYHLMTSNLGSIKLYSNTCECL